MKQYRYLIIGGGMTADSAVRGIREVDPHGSIGLIGAEPDAPYKRPPLSKGLWKGDAPESAWCGTDQLGVSLHLGRRVTRLDAGAHRATDDRGDEYAFDKLLLATGGAPRRLPFGGERVIYYRTWQDYQKLKAVARPGVPLVVIGGGFIGSEIAAALCMNGSPVTVIMPEEGIGWRVFPADLARFVNDYYRDKGVQIRAGESVAGIEERGNRLIVKTQGPGGASELEAGGVVAGLGIQPNVELAQSAGLPVENGVQVDDLLRTGHPDIYAAGDVAQFYNPALDKRLRVEHEDNANTMGRQAGRNMAGMAEPYQHLPFFYSDLFELGYEAVGELDSRLETVSDWKDPFREGVLYYMRGGRVRGVLLWNVWEQVENARRLIAEPGPFRPGDLIGRLPAKGKDRE